MNERYINVGYIKDILTKKIIYSLNENNDVLNKEITDFIDIISESEILKKEYDLFESLSNNYIPSEIIASRFLDNFISKLNTYSIEDINNEHLKLKKFIDENIHIDEKKYDLYKNVSDLIYESLKSNNNSNTNLLFEAYTNILKKITNDNKNIKKEKQNNNILNENILNIAINKFNKKYSNLNENDILLLKKLFTSNYIEKNKIYDELKNENLNLLNDLLLTEDYNKNKIKKAIDIIQNIKLTKNNINENIIKLYELNIGLKSD